ncbi:calcium-binding protein [Streptomyces sp. NPDC059063]|uniref:calcium-binding protein n=1 Tax=unclassified Streptomyces TaxID=2593676 RepID=UPI00368162FB
MSSRPTSRRVLRAVSALTLAVGAGVGLPAGLASTATAAVPSATAVVSDNGRQVVYTAAFGQTNKVAVTQSFTADGSRDIAYVIDDVVPVRAGRGCVHPDGADRTKVACTADAVDSQDPYATLSMDVGDRDDTVAFHNATDQAYYTNSLFLGPGKDTLNDTGSVDGNFVRGDAGNDTLTVGAAATAFGGDGADTIRADGDATVADGGKGNDVIRGGAGDQQLYGDDGADKLYGGSGSDLLYGGKGNDVLYGNAGIDQLYGNSGDDKLYGGAGRDTLSGGPGRDVVRQD